MRKMFEQSAETTAIVNVFLAMKMSQRMTFGELSRAVKFTVQSSSPAYVSGRRIAERDHGIFIGSARGVGFYRGTGEDMADSLEPLALRMRRTALRSIKRADLAINNNLTQQKYQQVSERRNRASIIYSTSCAPMPVSNRKRREPVQEAEPFNRFAALETVI